MQTCSVSYSPKITLEETCKLLHPFLDCKKCVETNISLDTWELLHGILRIPESVERQFQGDQSIIPTWLSVLVCSLFLFNLDFSVPGNRDSRFLFIRKPLGLFERNSGCLDLDMHLKNTSY